MKIKNKCLLSLFMAMLTGHLVLAQWSVSGDYTISGKVGVGTLSPEAKLEIQSSGSIGGIFDPSLAFFKITDGTTTLIADGNEIHSNQSLVFGSSYTRDFKFRNVDGTGFQDLLIIKSTGNVGIGIETPEEKLEVDGNVQIGYNQFLKGRRADNMISNLIGYIPHESGHHVLAFSEYSSIPSEVRIYTPTDINQGVSIYSDKRLVFFRNDGNVGIGTNNPGSKLVVNGKIRSEEIKVEIVNGPDYVFEPDYKLPKLRQIKKYINENKHLPEIPSAKEMESNGVDLGDMNMKLLKKIEELTLYQIQLLERLEHVEATNQLMQQELRELKSEKKSWPGN